MAKTSTAKRCQGTQPGTNLDGSGLYNETSQPCWIFQLTAGLNGQSISHLTAEAEKHQESPPGGRGGLWRERGGRCGAMNIPN